MAPRAKRDVRKVKVRIDSAEAMVDTNPIREECLASPIAVVQHHRRASSSPELERSVTQEENLDRLKSMYAILDNLRMTVLW